MAFFSELEQQIELLRSAFRDDVVSASLPHAIEALDDDAVVDVIAQASALAQAGEKLRIAASGVMATRSTREHGHSGLAQKRGHRSPVSLVQEITGSTRADAAKFVRLGESLLSGTAEEAANPAGTSNGDDTAPALWHAPLGRALLAGTITSAQHDVILRGLGEPPVGDSDDVEAARVVEVWSLAAEQLVAEAQHRTVEELARTARTCRDRLDPEGAQRRFDERFERRSFRMWTDADGVRRGSIAFDDFAATWVQSVIDAALRPRRGGPRFVDPDEKARAEELANDPRTNEQLTYDLIIDMLRAGTLAEPETVFGTRQAGVRVVITEDAAAAARAGAPAVGHVEDDGTALLASLIQQLACDSGTIEVTFDRDGNPLYLGREARLFSARQKVTLAIRDGGCRWRGCDRPPSYCEAHHIDEYARDEGRTDVDRGILLCRFHRAPRGAVLIGGDVRSLPLARRGGPGKLRAA